MFWGIDLGGTKIEGVVVPDASRPEPLSRIRLDTEREKGYDYILGRIRRLVDRLAEEAGERPRSIGVAHPGAVDSQSGKIKNSNTTVFNGRRLTEDLKQALGAEIIMANDANCFALAETRWGAARGARTAFGVIMGTGVGGGMVVDGKVLFGAQGIAGEWGHNCLIPEGTTCYCGRKGCVETVISGPALERYYQAIADTRKPLRQIAADASHGRDPHAEETMKHLLSRFGQALAVVINIFDPEYVVLGGGLSNIEVLYTQGPAEVEKNVFNNGLRTKIVKNNLGDSAGVFGAALLGTEGSLQPAFRSEPK